MNFNIKSLYALILALILIYILWKMKKKNLNFGIITLLSMFMGLTVGLIFKNNVEYITPIGKIYINLITATVVPLLFTSVFSSVVSLKDVTKLKTIGARAVFWLVLNTVIASGISIFLGISFKVGKNMNNILIDSYSVEKVPSFLDTIVNLFPKNIFGDASNNNIVAIIIFSILLGVAEIFVSVENSELTKPFKKFIESFQSIINMVISFLVEFTPYAVLSLVANAVSNSGVTKLLPLLNILFISYLACFIQIFFVCGGLVLIFGKINPFKFFKKIWTSIVVAFTSQSSIGTIPILIECLTKKVGISKSICSFVTPLGATMGMPGCSGIWPTILAIVVINSLGINYSFFDYLFLIILTAVVSIGTVGVPGTATISATAVLTAAGLPIEIIVITMPINTIVDMVRTATNVTSSATSTLLVAKSQNKIDFDIFNT